VVSLYRRHPRAAALYGAVQMVDGDGRSIEMFEPAPFKLGPLMRCELVVPFSTSFFSRKVCGAELRCDVSLRTCADFDLWLRLSGLKIVRIKGALGRTRLSSKSMTRDPSRYEQFCLDKITALEHHIGRRPELAGHRAEAIAGVYCWAAESLFAIEGPSERCRTMLDCALAAAPDYERVSAMAARVTERLQA
jgi:hypothetical protein